MWRRAWLWLMLGAISAAPAAEPPLRRPGGVGPQFKVHVFKSADGVVVRYGLLPPQQVVDGERYPLVVCLHGRGGNTTAADVLAGPKLREKYPCYIFAPDSDGARWARPAAAGGADDAERLPAVVDAVRMLLKSEPIDPERIYVTGQSMGGFGSWGAAARYPEFFAAAAPICGGWIVADAEKLKSVPIWAFHGDADPTVPVRFSRDMVEAVRQAGGTIKYTEYPGVGHNSWDRAYATPELWDWLFAQRRPAAETPKP